MFGCLVFQLISVHLFIYFHYFYLLFHFFKDRYNLQNFLSYFMLHQVHYIFVIYLHSSRLYMALIKINFCFISFNNQKITISSIQCIFMQNICIASIYLFEKWYRQYVYLENWNRYYAYCKKQKIGIGCISIQKIGISSIFMQKIGISSIFM